MEKISDQGRLRPWMGLVLFAAVMALFVFAFAPLQQKLGIPGLLITEFGFLAIAVIYCLISKEGQGKRSIRKSPSCARSIPDVTGICCHYRNCLSLERQRSRRNEFFLIRCSELPDGCSHRSASSCCMRRSDPQRRDLEQLQEHKEGLADRTHNGFVLRNQSHVGLKILSDNVPRHGIELCCSKEK